MVRTRFAPSPTGYLHIGGVRTALFNWLFARHHGGQFILRIDDTDKQRNVEAALAPILAGFRWLGIDWDEGPEVGGPYGPYFQSQRSERYQAAVMSLLQSGAAYYDYAPPGGIAGGTRSGRAREADLHLQSPIHGRNGCRASKIRSRRSLGRRAAENAREGNLVMRDLIRGDVEFEWAAEQDHVMQRADGSCLYHLATVVDDHDFEISHVIRAEEHLSNTPRQIFIAQAWATRCPNSPTCPLWPSRAARRS